MKPTVVPLGVAPKRKTTGELDFQTEVSVALSGCFVATEMILMFQF